MLTYIREALKSLHLLKTRNVYAAQFGFALNRYRNRMIESNCNIRQEAMKANGVSTQQTQTSSIAHLVAPDAVDRDDEADAAGILLESGVVEADWRRVIPWLAAAHRAGVWLRTLRLQHQTSDRSGTRKLIQQ